MKILVAEDDQVLADGLSRGLRAAGYVVDHAADGSQAEAALGAQRFDLLILDLGLPKIAGLDVLRRLRARNDDTPVLILTAGDSVEQRVRGLDIGADDFMAKPFALSELEARVRALVRRRMGASVPLLKHGQLTYDQVGRAVYFNDVLVDLPAREVGLIEILLSRVGRLVNKEQIVAHLCEWGEEISSNAVEVYMHRLRKKLEGAGVVVTTVRGLGYCLEKYPNEPSAKHV